MCTSITVLNQKMWSTFTVTNIAGSNIVTHAVVIMETLSLFQQLKGISERTAFLKDGLVKYDFSAG